MNNVYIEFDEKYFDQIIKFYMDYYNSDGGKWTYEKAYKRLHQIYSMDDSLIIMLFVNEKLVGFLMGYFKYFDDCTGFFLEEILISKKYQNKGYGTDFLTYLKDKLMTQNCDWIELMTTTETMHQRFYGKNGYKKSDHLVLEYLDLI